MQTELLPGVRERVPQAEKAGPVEQEHPGVQSPDRGAISRDTLFNGRLVCRQHRHGYRFSVDAVLLAHFVRPAARVLDLCAGCGVIGLIMLFRTPEIEVTAVELQAALARLIRDNARENGYAKRLTVYQLDAVDLHKTLAPESFDLVVCNPPFRSASSGRISHGSEAALARHEITAGIVDFTRAAAFAVKNRGRVAMIYPANRFAVLVEALAKWQLIVKRVRPVYSYPQSDTAVLVLVEAVKNGGSGLHFLEPLFLHTCSDGPYTDEVITMYEG